METARYAEAIEAYRLREYSRRPHLPMLVGVVAPCLLIGTVGYGLWLCFTSLGSMFL